MSICKKTVTETAELLRTRKISADELVKEYFDEIKKKNPDINAYVTICEDEAIKAAEAAQKIMDSNNDVPYLCGIPMTLKDNICTKNIKTTCASKMLEDFLPPYSATVYKKLLDSGTVLLGKLNMDEFAMGNSSEHSIFGAVHNPWNTAFVAGGSSGGSAASVASNLAAFALGSDTGGGIRQPASFCGVVGLKPTYGLVSRYGLIAFASSLEQIGIISKDITDCGIIMNVITGHDPMDSTSIKRPAEDYSEGLGKNIDGIKIALPKELFGSELEKEVGNVINDTLKRLESRGAVLSDCSLPTIENAIHAYYIISSSEASSNLARYDGIRYGHRNERAENISDLYRKSRTEGFGQETKRRILLGTYALSAEHQDELYKKALKVRNIITREFRNAFDEYDIIAAPVSPVTAFKLQENLNNPLKMYLKDVYTVAANLAGLPAVSIPCGKDKKGLPIGIQLIGKPFSEKLLLNVGKQIEMEAGRLEII
ncbi:MAG TPA: Asp-tRNA(Asn)/Glu-tRNA(Gln) amidotransferase subunit GatA [Clostridiaceae bacterium]|jgi:aspartyl-tRNA(Asn)/glutamyl-tRNA(Gln) amidotransferase subunit A|nr:Asp-tRNA(Asn)/Glu-tRNA(Gln) amidotransferase subunit GatA [Clostridiaceae bacterium]